MPGLASWVDLVAHCGSSTRGFCLCTLCAVDITTAWVELDAVWGKNQERVGSAVHRVRERLPVPLVGLDSDNGSEFIKSPSLDLGVVSAHPYAPSAQSCARIPWSNRGASSATQVGIP